MNNLLLISDDPGAPTLVARLTGRESAHLAVRRTPEEAAAPIAAGAFELVVVHALAAGAGLAARVAAVRGMDDRLPVLVLAADGADPARAAQLYGAGADAVLPASVEPAVFAAVCRRLTRPHAAPPPPPPAPEADAPAAGPGVPALEVLRDFSRVLSFSLDERQFVHHFLLKLREIVAVNRIAVFIEPPAAAPGALHRAAPGSRLVCAGAIGIPQDIAGCFELSLTSGVGRRVAQTGQILRLRRDSPLALQHEDPRVLREFEVLGGQVAVPVSDRERCFGVAILGGKLTGERFTSPELELLCHLLEELGLALKNSRLHAELAASHRLVNDVLAASAAATLVLGADLGVWYANRAAREFLGRTDEAGPPPAFTDLPPRVATAVNELGQQGRAAAPFLTELPARPDRVFRASVIPFARDTRALPQPVMLVLEDCTAAEAAKRSEIESANLKMVALIARRFAHEIRNSLVPLTTHQQLFDSEYASEEFRQSLKNALTTETGRIQRFTEQMLFLSHPQNPPADIGPVETLLRDAFAQAQTILNRPATLDLDTPADPPLVKFNRPSLLHALKEVFLNAIQSAPAGATVRVVLRPAELRGENWLAVSFRDGGAGFAADVLPHALEPFFTKRNTGVGLGLTVAKKIVEDHRGRLELRPRVGPDSPDVVLFFPQDF